ncbi:MAG: low molecular weight phosphotyrosine protein phosphatase [Burkholderiales bacterium]|nr:low molecular weight phosphotyrosine protein phosphatase [Burkholderiales bacterium]
MDVVRVLFVCTGNVCRSPMAQAVGRNLMRGAGLAVRVDFDSAGTRSVPGRAAIDPRARAVLERAGYACGSHRARPMRSEDFAANDLVLAMDAGHLRALRALAAPEHAHKLRLFLDLAPGFEGQDVPDPYYGDAGGFDRVLALCEAGVRGLLAAVPALTREAVRRPIKDPCAD